MVLDDDHHHHYSNTIIRQCKPLFLAMMSNESLQIHSRATFPIVVLLSSCPLGHFIAIAIDIIVVSEYNRRQDFRWLDDAWWMIVIVIVIVIVILSMISMWILHLYLVFYVYMYVWVYVCMCVYFNVYRFVMYLHFTWCMMFSCYYRLPTIDVLRLHRYSNSSVNCLE